MPERKFERRKFGSNTKDSFKAITSNCHYLPSIEYTGFPYFQRLSGNERVSLMKLVTLVSIVSHPQDPQGYRSYFSVFLLLLLPSSLSSIFFSPPPPQADSFFFFSSILQNFKSGLTSTQHHPAFHKRQQERT